jgi:hypothetical protein
VSPVVSKALAAFSRSPTTADPAPVASLALSTSIFLRSLAIIHAIAFASIWSQIPGLIGPHGILPAAPFLRAVRDYYGSSAFLKLPTLAWLFGADTFLHVLCVLGILAATLLFAGIAPIGSLAILWLAYLSLVNVGQSFLSFQWDALLLEATFFAIFLAPRSLLPRWHLVEPPPLARWLLRWLTFRLMLMSGAVKLTSGDPSWRDLTALTFHFETQPLPNPVAFWIHHLPAQVHVALCAGMFAIELVAPFFLFAHRRARHAAALLLAALQILIFLTGNYAFFNLLTLALCLLNLDDAFWRTTLFRRQTRPKTLAAPPPPASRPIRLISTVLASLVVAFTAVQGIPSLYRSWQPPAWISAVGSHISPFNTLNNYGLFAVMTTSRPELIIEGSNDGREWSAYELPYKPGDLSRPPPIVAPHQPRFDWQLWFAALGHPSQNRWLTSVCEHLLRGTPDVLRLFSYNPFAEKPPRYVRVVRYDYHFTSIEERSRTGTWWRRTPLDYYIAPASLP